LRGTIICEVNDAEEGRAALRVGSWLAHRFGSRIVLVTIAETEITAAAEGLSATRRRSDAPLLLRRLAAEHDLAGRCDERTEVGTRAEVLAAVAAEEAAELIILGARPGLRKGTLRNDHARELAATATCPVVVAPP
jgi:nucleotide-binding universal stress UspA family protein